MQEPGSKGIFQVSATREGSDYIMGRVVSLERSREILGADQGEVILYRKHFRLLMQMIDRGHHNAAGDYAQGRIWDSLEF